MRPASEVERRRLNDTFARLCAIPSPFGSERACAEAVARELRTMGLGVEEDGAAADTGAECGNLLARVPGRGERTILLCAHLDTVPEAGMVEPVVEDGGWVSAGDTILGADNKAAVAVILELARRCAVEGSPVGLELLFTVSEENALAGAKAFDVGSLQADWGYVFDHASPIGEIIVAARCRVVGEARSLDARKADATIAEIIGHIHDAANTPACFCDVDVTTQRLFDGYRHGANAPAVVAAEAALRACGYTPVRRPTGGGSDANAFEAAGLHCTNLANGTERNHEPDERVSVAALEGMLDVAFALLDACSA